jgi:Icc-related predicted phosphoesterase
MLTGCSPGAVLVSHSPPAGHVDEAFGRRLGSHALLRAVQRVRPALVLCGHIHQAWGQESFVDDVRVFNLGPEGHWFEV